AAAPAAMAAPALGIPGGTAGSAGSFASHLARRRGTLAGLARPHAHTRTTPTHRARRGPLAPRRARDRALHVGAPAAVRRRTGGAVPPRDRPRVAARARCLGERGRDRVARRRHPAAGA